MYVYNGMNIEFLDNTRVETLNKTFIYLGYTILL